MSSHLMEYFYDTICNVIIYFAFGRRANDNDDCVTETPRI